MTYSNRKNIYRTTLICCMLSFMLASFSPLSYASKKDPKKGYRISLTIKGGKDTVMYMGNYYVGKTYATDTARINKKGQFVFENQDRQLLPGLYFFTNPQGRYVEFVVHNEEPFFAFETENNNWTANMKVKGSHENDIFFLYNTYRASIYGTVDSAYNVYQKEGKSEAEFNAFRDENLRILDSIERAMVDTYPKTMVSLLINARHEPFVPNNSDMTEYDRFIYYIDHYFDNTDLTDDALVRTPDAIFHKRFVNYFDSYLHGAEAEMICRYADTLIEKARPSKEVFKYLVHTITEKYLQTNIMGYDAVYVHLIKRYYATGEAYWSSPSVIDENVKRAETWERLLIGKEAPDLYMRDDNGLAYQLHKMPGKYKLLIFWSPSCGHCKTMIPELYKTWVEMRDKYQMSAYAVLSEPDDHNRPLWRKMIKEKGLTEWVNVDGGEANIDWHEVYDVITTPQIYLLDQDNKIVAKKLNAELLVQIMNILEKEKK